jgi:hypothetical protein
MARNSRENPHSVFWIEKNAEPNTICPVRRRAVLPVFLQSPILAYLGIDRKPFAMVFPRSGFVSVELK